jgi:DnaJ-class molecular chaperone
VFSGAPQNVFLVAQEFPNKTGARKKKNMEKIQEMPRKLQTKCKKCKGKCKKCKGKCKKCKGNGRKCKKIIKKM